PRCDSARPLHAVDAVLSRWINDARDLTFLHLSFSITTVMLPFAALLYWPGVFRWWVAAIYLVINFAVYFDRYVLMLHNTSHRALFRKPYRWMNYYIPTLLGPFFGQSPWTYYAHHIGMHHPENNLAPDASSTMRYDRDSFRDFLLYWLRFFGF